MAFSAFCINSFTIFTLIIVFIFLIFDSIQYNTVYNLVILLFRLDTFSFPILNPTPILFLCLIIVLP